jgi:hypothetical protein
MLKQVSGTVFAHSLVNPPTFSSSCDITLILINPVNLITLKKDHVGFQTKYSLTVLEPSSLGLSSYDDNVVNEFLKTVVIAMEINLRRTALTFSGVSYNLPQVEFSERVSSIKVEENAEGKKISITETVFLRDSVHITTSFSEEIDETEVIHALKLLDMLNKYKDINELKRSNLRKSIDAYYYAMSVFDRVLIFKNLFNSLEFAVNWDKDRKNELKGEAFDKEVADITSLPQSEITEWRKIYDRTKHVDREPKELSEYVSGTEKIPSILEKLRITTNKLIIKRLAESTTI